MEEVLESIFADEEMPVLYATFWQRLGAVIIDGLIFSLIIPLNIYNETTGKSVALLLVSAAITILYKPFCEYKYGATVGKMALKIVVINKAYQKPHLQEAIGRNIFQIIFAALNLAVTLLVFTNTQFKAATTFTAYATLRNEVGFVNFITFSICIVYLIDAVFLMSDYQRRSLHDRIAATYVIKRCCNCKYQNADRVQNAVSVKTAFLWKLKYYSFTKGCVVVVLLCCSFSK